MQLPEAKRVQYIQDVQKMLIELSTSPGRFSDSDPKARSRVKAWLQIISQQITEVEAEAGGSGARDDGAPLILTARRIPATIEQYVSEQVALGNIRCRSVHFPSRSTVEFSGDNCTDAQEGRIKVGFATVFSRSINGFAGSPQTIAAQESSAIPKPAAELITSTAVTPVSTTATAVIALRTPSVPGTAQDPDQATPAQVLSTNAEPKVARKSAVSVPFVSAQSCAPKPVFCADAKTFRSAAFTGNNGKPMACVFAGMISELRFAE
jgi:hypothetical protein